MERQLTEQLMREVDSRIESPQQIAARLLARLRAIQPEPSIYETLCFSCEMIGLACHEYPQFEEDAKRLLALLYRSHYLYGIESTTTRSNDGGESESNGGGVVSESNGVTGG